MVLECPLCVSKMFEQFRWAVRAQDWKSFESNGFHSCEGIRDHDYDVVRMLVLHPHTYAHFSYIYDIRMRQQWCHVQAGIITIIREAMHDKFQEHVNECGP